MAINKIDFEQLMNQARVTLVGSSDAGIKGAFYDVLTEFFNDSSCWTQDVQFNALSTKAEYALSVSEGQIIRLVGVCTPATPASGAPFPPGTFFPALMPAVGVVSLKCPPQTATTLVATFVTNVALPTDRHSVPQGPDWALPLWHVGLLDGLLGKMMLQPNKSYSSVTASAYHLKRFRDAIARARVSKLRANTNGAQAWRFPQSYRMGSQQGGVPAVGSASERTF